jgi:hypothetical protein
MHTRHLPITILCLGGLLALTGCQQAPPSVDLGPQLDGQGMRRSVALDTPLLNHIESRRPASQGLPWYADRNDLSPSANAGYVSPTVQSSVTVTRDQQYSTNGRVYDNFYSTTYRTEYRQSVR